jgi:hypothetical protein
MSRHDSLFDTLRFNPKARFVTREVRFGSEHLFDHAIDAGQLVEEMKSAKAKLADLKIPAMVSEMGFAFERVSLTYLFAVSLEAVVDGACRCDTAGTRCVGNCVECDRLGRDAHAAILQQRARNIRWVLSG